jgi:hypothetical protein
MVPRSKAVPDGALLGHLCPSMKTRIAKFTYGMRSRRTFRDNEDCLVERQSQAIRIPSGKMMIPGAFSSILSKVNPSVLC